MSEVGPATAAAPMPLSFAAVAAKSAANAPAATAPSAEQNSAGGSGEGAAPAGSGRPAPQAAPDKAGAGAASSSSAAEAAKTGSTPVLSNGTSAPAAAVIGGGPNNDMAAAQPQSQAAAAIVLPQDMPVGTVLNGTVLNGTSVNGVQGQWGGVPLGHIVQMGGSPVIVGASPYQPVDPAQMQAQMQAAAVNAQQQAHAAAAVAVVATPDASPTLNGADGPSNDTENKAPGANYQQNQQQHPEPRCSDVKLFVGQVPRTCDEPDLIPIFSRYGPLTDVSVIRHKYDGTHRGCAFVTYQYPQDAAVALREVHDRVQMGPRAKRCLQVRYASEPGQYVPRNPYGGGGGNHQHQHHQNGGGYPPQHHQNGYHQQGQQQQFDPGKFCERSGMNASCCCCLCTGSYIASIIIILSRTKANEHANATTLHLNLLSNTTQHNKNQIWRTSSSSG